MGYPRMKIFLIVLFLFLCVKAADLTISGVEVGAEGWNVYVTIANTTEGGTFLIDHGTNHTTTASTPWLYVKRYALDSTGVRSGFIYDTVFIDTIVDKRTPNTGTDSTYVSGSDVVALCALSDFICVKDTVKGVFIAGNFYTNGADATVEYTASSATNSSVATYPQAFASLNMPDRVQQKGDSIYLSIKPGSYWGRNGKSVKSVIFKVQDEHSNIDSIIVTSPSADMKRFTTPFFPKNDSVCNEVWDGKISNTQFTSGDTLLIDFRVVPWVGDESEVLTSQDGVFDENSHNYHTLVHVCDHADTYGSMVACVDTTTGIGNDATGAIIDSASFNPASPPNKYQTVAAAVNAIAAYNNTNYGHNDPGGAIIYMYSHTYGLGGSITTLSADNQAFATLRPAPDTAFGYLKITGVDGSKEIANRSRIVGMKIDTAIAAGFFGGANILWLDSCVIDVAENTLFYNNTITYITNSRLGELSRGLINFGGVDAKFPIITGNYFYGSSDKIMYQNFSGNIMDSTVTSFTDTTLNVARSRGTIFECNKVIRFCGAGGRLIDIKNVVGDSSGHSVSNNLVENKNYQAVPQAIYYIAADGSTVDLKQFILANNTVAGWRKNGFYNDAGTTPVYRTFIRQLNNLFEDDNIKADNFGTFNANRTGNWSPFYGAGASGNINAESEVGADGFLYRFPGISTIQEPKTSSVGDDSTYMGWVDRKAWNGLETVSNVGGGDYHLQDTSKAIGLPTVQYFTYDLDGNIRGAIGTSDSIASGVFAYSAETVTSALQIDSISPDSAQIGIDSAFILGDYTGHTGIDSIWFGSVKVTDLSFTTSKIGFIAPSVTPGWYGDSTIITDGTLTDTLFGDSIYFYSIPPSTTNRSNWSSWSWRNRWLRWQ